MRALRTAPEKLMRARNSVLLVTLGVALSVASCTLITDVDRSDIPAATGGTSEAGATSTGGGSPNETGGAGGMGGTGGNAGGLGGMAGHGGAAAGMGGA
jgi:hypothetical protein